jgi:hypothetical protein
MSPLSYKTVARYFGNYGNRPRRSLQKNLTALTPETKLAGCFGEGSYGDTQHHDSR